MTIRRIWCNVLAALFSMVVIMPLTYMLLDREPPISLRYLPVQPEGPVASGSTVRITYLARLYRLSCDGSFVRRIVDSSGFTNDTKPLRMITFEALAGNSHGTFSKDIILPSMSPGPATYQIFTTYWCNPLQHYVWPMTHAEDVVRFTIKGQYPPPAPPISDGGKAPASIPKTVGDIPLEKPPALIQGGQD